MMLVDAALNEPLGKVTVDHACGNRGSCNLMHLRTLPLKLNRRLGDHRKLYSIIDMTFELALDS